MSKIDEVRSAMVAAMKAKDKDTKETLSALLAALKNKAIDKRADLTEEEEVQVILKEIKQTKETLEMTPADRTDIIEECVKRIAVLEQYAPKMMDEAEIKEVIAGVLSGLGIDAPTPKDKGRIMKELMPKVKGKADESFRLFNLWKMSRILYAHVFYSRYMLLILFSNLNTVFIILSRDNADTICRLANTIINICLCISTFDACKQIF